MAIQIADGFQLRVAKPLDDRQNVETVAQLDPTYGYEGQIVYVKDIKQFYTCYKDENGSLAYKVMEIAKIHEHVNQDVLDKLSDDGNGNLLYDSNLISVNEMMTVIELNNFLDTLEIDGVGYVLSTAP